MLDLVTEFGVLFEWPKSEERMLGSLIKLNEIFRLPY